MCGGYIAWGISIISFALIRADVISSVFGAAAGAASLAVMGLGGGAAFAEGHKAHAALLRDEASGNDPKIMTLLLVHAEDQLMAAETFRTLALEFIDVYKKIYAADTP